MFVSKHACVCLFSLRVRFVHRLLVIAAVCVALPCSAYVYTRTLHGRVRVGLPQVFRSLPYT